MEMAAVQEKEAARAAARRPLSEEMGSSHGARHESGGQAGCANPVASGSTDARQSASGAEATHKSVSSKSDHNGSLRGRTIQKGSSSSAHLEPEDDEPF